MSGLPRLHRLWIVPGLALAVAANAVATDNNLGLLPVLGFGIMPHLPVLLGLGEPRGRGQIGPRAVPLFNALHQPFVPIVLAAGALAGLLPSLWLVAGLAWLGHIVIDWGLGAGRRAPDGGPVPTTRPTFRAPEAARAAR